MMYINGQAVAPTNTVDGGNIGYKVTFKINNADYYIASCLQGESISEPMISGENIVNAWVDANGNVITFPYQPSGDITLFAVLNSIKYLQQVNGLAQYIDTGYIPNDNSKFICEYEYPQIINYGSPFGIRNNSNNAENCWFMHSPNTNSSVGWGGRDQKSLGDNSQVANKRYKLTYEKGHIKVENLTDETVRDEYFTASAFSGSRSMYYCKPRQDDSSGNEAGKHYYLKIYENDELVNYFVPYVDNGVGCFKDLVSGQIHYNAGTGDFIIGDN